MVKQVSKGFELLLASFTLVGGLSCVSSHVGEEVALLNKYSSAFFVMALISGKIGVRTFIMLRKSQLAGAAVVTARDLASEVFFFRVRVLVVPQVLLELECFAAVGVGAEKFLKRKLYQGQDMSLLTCFLMCVRMFPASLQVLSQPSKGQWRCF